jgi:S1-C subfamily serine protease
MKEVALILAIICFVFTTCNSQSIQLLGKQFGLIETNDTLILGSGFVMLKPNLIITAAHVIKNRKNISFLCADTARYIFKNLKVIKIDYGYDFAILQSDNEICPQPLVASQDFKITPGQHLFYMGYRSAISSKEFPKIQIDNLFVTSVGLTKSLNKIVQFIEFNGVGIPGYSGGPVFNDKNEVVGFMDEAFYKRGIWGDTATLVNRAYSVLPILK